LSDKEDMEVTIERILPGGLGLAHAEGGTVLVALAAPGDRVRVQIERVKGNVSFARIEEIGSASQDRVEPPCPYFGRCGGCDFQQLNYDAQLNSKVEIIKDCLRRLARIENIPEMQVTAAPEPWRYRTRAQWQYDAVRQTMGYFESGSRRVCDVAECAVLAPELQQTLSSLRALMQSGSLREDVRDFRAVVGDVGVSLAPPVQDQAVVDIKRSVHGESYTLNAERFFQANDQLLPQLIDAAIGDVNGGVALELYSGVGLFTIPLARRFARVMAVESDARAAVFARKNLANANLNNAEIAHRDVANWLDHDAKLWLNQPGKDSGRLDYLLLDPPRTGAESRVIASILRLRPQKLCYVSCDPATLARDLKKLLAGGYALTSIAAFDMFPQTHHVETVVQLVSSADLAS
jgi:23S rRNA (uracil1939-C5)-methyltransferase